MTDFNLFLAVGNKQHLEFCLTCNAKNILISYAYPEAWQMVPLLQRNECRILMDSGAFTSWNQAQKKKNEGDPNWEKYLIDIDEYAKFIEKYKDIIFRAVNLDVIPGSTGVEPTQEQRIEAAEQGWKNYQYLKKLGHNTIHVFHQGDPIEYLDRMLNECDYIGVSPCNDYTTERKLVWLDTTFRHILNSNNPHIKTHGFGVTAERLIRRYPWYSCDSSSHSFTAGLGTIYTPWGRIYVSDRNQSDPDHIINKPKEIQEHIDKYLKENVGHSLKQMMTNEEDYTLSCPACHTIIPHTATVQSYKVRNYANIVHFLNIEQEIKKVGPTLDFMKQKTLL